MALALLLSSRSASDFCSYKRCFVAFFRSSYVLVPCQRIRTEINPSSFLALFCHQKHLESHLGRRSTHNVRCGTKHMTNFSHFFFFFFHLALMSLLLALVGDLGSSTLKQHQWRASRKAQVSYSSSCLLSLSPSAPHLPATKNRQWHQLPRFN